MGLLSICRGRSFRAKFRPDEKSVSQLLSRRNKRKDLHPVAQVERKFKLHICAMKSCVCGTYAVYCCQEESNQKFPLSARNAESLERNGAVYRKAKNSCNMKTAYLRYAIQRCCCCIKKLNCYIIGCEIRNYGSLIIQQNEASCSGFPAQEAFLCWRAEIVQQGQGTFPAP